MSEELKLEDLKPVPVGGLSEEDMDKYNGTRVKIGKVAIEYTESRWKDGVELPEGQTVRVPQVAVETEPIGQDALGQPITVKEWFPLKQNKVTGEWGPSLHPKSKCKKFFDLLKINRFEEAVGREVVVIKKRSSSGRAFLGINIG